MSAAERFFERVGCSIPANAGNPSYPHSNSTAVVYVTQNDSRRSHWSVLLSLDCHTSGFSFSGHMTANDARLLARTLYDAAELMTTEEAAFATSEAAQQVKP
jgi:hypothetical protein